MAGGGGATARHAVGAAVSAWWVGSMALHGSKISRICSGREISRICSKIRETFARLPDFFQLHSDQRACMFERGNAQCLLSRHNRSTVPFEL